MRFTFLIFIVFLGIVSCNHDQENTASNTKERLNETASMVKELEQLVNEGTPELYYHWNSLYAEQLKLQLNRLPQEQNWPLWLQYCQELLYAGKSRECIDEIEKAINTANYSYDELINKENTEVFELLALAYLRLGEQENCQNKHTPFSCILPLKTAAIHEIKEGSEKAITIYELLQDHFPNEQYKWLINLAYMTLGKYPNEVPTPYRINFPNWKLEQENFPRFNEIAMNVGLAANGLSGGTCVDDFNNDGILDIFATSYGMQDPVKLFLNNGHGSFSDVSQKAGLKGIVSGLNCLHADYDNDGYKDVLVLRGGWLGKVGNHPNSLLKNNGDGTFSDVTKSSGLLSYHPTQTASWADFNKDGLLDLFIGNESSKDDIHSCELYQNNGDGTFKEVAKQYGLGEIKQFIKGVTWGDINNDGWPDLFISVMGGHNLLFKNTNGKFNEIGKSAQIQEPIFSFPCWFWDVNNDGFQDIFVSGYDIRNLEALSEDYAKELQGIMVKTDKPRLYLNNGDETFTEQATNFNISKTMYGMGANFGDLDNDGWLDFYIGTGAPSLNSVIPNRMFRNLEGEKFEEVTSAGGFGHIQKGHGVAFADLDRDGDQDIYAVIGGAYEGDVFTNVLFENPISKNNWICIELEGTKTNRSAIGTRLELVLDNGRKIVRTISTGGSFGASSLQQEIGLGKASKIKELTIHWQNSQPQKFDNIGINQKIRIKEEQNDYQKMNYLPIPFQVNHSSFTSP